jgi:GrpB-like predicted nucleotidyltransferase (UPF0157 family)
VLVIREPGWFQHRCPKGPDTNLNLHVHRPTPRRSSAACSSGSGCAPPPEDRARYQRVKRELAQRDWTYVQQYADAKTEVIEEIIARARGAAAAAEGGPAAPA